MGTNGNGFHGKFQARFARKGLNIEAADCLLAALQDPAIVATMLEKGYAITPPDDFMFVSKQRAVIFEVHAFRGDNVNVGTAATYIDTAVELVRELCGEKCVIDYNIFAMRVDNPQGATNAR